MEVKVGIALPIPVTRYDCCILFDNKRNEWHAISIVVENGEF